MAVPAKLLNWTVADQQGGCQERQAGNNGTNVQETEEARDALCIVLRTEVLCFLTMAIQV